MTGKGVPSADQPFGLLPVDKPIGVTSHDVVAVARRALRMKRIGHAGTLDPFASGLLILMIGKATKLFDTFMAYDKTYEAVMRLGERTATGDPEGDIEETSDPAVVTETAIRKAFSRFQGTMEQVPPMYSALKHNGRKLYEYAREGISVDVPARKIVLYDNVITSISVPEVAFTVRCSKGTYIRKLAEDLGAAMGSCAHLTALRRTRIGPYGLDRVTTWDQLKKKEYTLIQPEHLTEKP